MTTYTATKARANLYRLIDQVAHSHKPIHISGKKTGAVLISEEDWSAIQETLYLLSIPNMGKSIRKGLKTPLNKCDENLDW
ncbi:MAG: antitoxin [Gammaproteobacteria bacterium RIFCSPHIGHO2_12_FULL_37_14]|nr:MAG: antitoxin [Gammaproteobacteria bacterium RIFCSPHIGHO2_12_FULL_37_14]